MAMNPPFSATYKPYVSALGHLGLTQEASHLHQRLLKTEPEFVTTGRWPATINNGPTV
jgi:hypothetical protein